MEKSSSQKILYENSKTTQGGLRTKGFHKDVKKVPIFICSKNSEIIKNLYKNNKIDEDKIRNHKDLYTLLLNYFGY